MRKTDKIAAVPKLLELLQLWVWYNDTYKLYFSKRKTNNPNEYYWFMLDLQSGKRKHGKYKVLTEGIEAVFIKSTYYIKELAGMRKFDIILIQITNVENELDYTNWMAAEIPYEKGKPYTIE